MSYGSASFGLEIRDANHINYYDGDGHIGVSPVSFAGAWCHLALVVNGANAKLYFNGALAGTGTADTTARNATQLTLGTSNEGDHLNAAVDNVRFYARALSADEVAVDRDQ